MPRGLRTEAEQFTVKETELPGFEDGQDDVTYTLRMIPVDIFRKALKDNEGKRGEMTLVGGFNLALDLFMYALVGWDGITADGQPVPCNDHYKKLLASNGPLARAIADKAGHSQLAAKESARGESFRPHA